jgi:hypothetical protein
MAESDQYDSSSFARASTSSLSRTQVERFVRSRQCRVAGLPRRRIKATSSPIPRERSASPTESLRVEVRCPQALRRARSAIPTRPIGRPRSCRARAAKCVGMRRVGSRSDTPSKAHRARWPSNAAGPLHGGWRERAPISTSPGVRRRPRASKAGHGVCRGGADPGPRPARCGLAGAGTGTGACRGVNAPAGEPRGRHDAGRRSSGVRLEEAPREGWFATEGSHAGRLPRHDRAGRGG